MIKQLTCDINEPVIIINISQAFQDQKEGLELLIKKSECSERDYGSRDALMAEIKIFKKHVSEKKWSKNITQATIWLQIYTKKRIFS